MSQTVVVDQDFSARVNENSLNKVFRHCRIGKVVPKRTYMPSPWGRPLKPFVLPSFVQRYSPEPRKCSCQPGSACGNAACPYGLIAIS